MKLNWNFLGRSGCKQKNLLLEEFGYFLELHVSVIADLILMFFV